jgi:hypothetical protein
VYQTWDSYFSARPLGRMHSSASGRRP